MVDQPNSRETLPDIPYDAVENAWRSLEPHKWDWRTYPRMKGRVSTPAYSVSRDPHEGIIVEFRLADVTVRTASVIFKAKAIVGAGYVVAIDADDADARTFAQRFVGQRFHDFGLSTPA